jgi:hypothetical protein
MTLFRMSNQMVLSSESLLTVLTGKIPDTGVNDHVAFNVLSGEKHPLTSGLLTFEPSLTG